MQIGQGAARLGTHRFSPLDVRYAFQYPPRVWRSLRAVKRPAGLENANVVACSSQTNQAVVSTIIGLASCPGRINVAPSTCAVERAMCVPFAKGYIVLGMLW